VIFRLSPFSPRKANSAGNDQQKSLGVYHMCCSDVCFILLQIWHNFMALCLVFIWRFFQFSHFFFSDFQLFRTEHHWRDLSCRNAHLVHQNWERISFTF
jgi:hypothetical protein